MVARWLLPVLAVLAFLGQAVTAWAATGTFGEAACCCPSPERCKCHDHDDRGDGTSQLRRCTGDAERVAPAPLAAAVAAPPVAVAELRAIEVAPPPILPPAEHRPPPPEPPPF